MPDPRHSPHMGPTAWFPLHPGGSIIGSAAVVAAILAVAAVFVVFVLVAVAHAATVSVSIDTTIHGPEGNRAALHAPVTPESIGLVTGALCQVQAVGFNQSSVHADNDVEVGDQAGFVTLADVEAVAGKITNADGLLVLPPLISFVLVMGPDEVYSGGLRVDLDCTDEPPTTTTTVATTTTTTPPDVTTTTGPPTATTTSTEPPPVGPPETGGGACADGGCAAGPLALALGAISGQAGRVVLALSVLGGIALILSLRRR